MDPRNYLSWCVHQVPHIDDIHEIRAEESEECILAMGMDLPMIPSTFNPLMRIPDSILEW